MRMGQYQGSMQLLVPIPHELCRNAFESRACLETGNAMGMLSYAGKASCSLSTSNASHAGAGHTSAKPCNASTDIPGQFAGNRDMCWSRDMCCVSVPCIPSMMYTCSRHCHSTEDRHTDTQPDNGRTCKWNLVTQSG